MKEDDSLVLADLALPDPIDQAGHGLAGVHRIEQDPLGPSDEVDRL